MTTYFRPNRSSCSFCKEDGHGVKSCNALASAECGYCHELGHTTRHCGKLSAKKQRRRVAEKVLKFSPDADGFVIAKRTSRRTPVRKKSYQTVKINRFEGLDDVANAIRPVKKQQLNGKWQQPPKIVTESLTESSKLNNPRESSLLKRRKNTVTAAIRAQVHRDAAMEGKVMGLEKDLKESYLKWSRGPMFASNSEFEFRNMKKFSGSWADAADEESDDEE